MRVKIEFGYDGKQFYGYQILPEKRTIQGELEKALSTLLSEDIHIVSSGRTDAKVSAIMQVAHFDTISTIVPTNIAFAVNKLLPKDIQVFSSKKVSDNFHARYSAKSKTYKYMFYFGEHINPVYENFAFYAGKKIDLDSMILASKFLIGKHDFSAFATKDIEVKNHVRELKNIEIVQIDGIFALKITGNAFLYNMARIIAGTLFDVGAGKIKPDDMEKILAKKERKNAGKLVPPEFLFLENVKY
jgi:tRNA pseudouridine38-40 synthase